MTQNTTLIPERGPITGTVRKVLVCALITMVGFNLRSVILAVPPVLPLIQHDLRLSYAETGLLTALPVLVLGGAAWPSGLLAERIGARTCVSMGLGLLGAGTLLRALWPAPLALFLCTLLLSLGIALAQTSVPVLARRWFPTQIGLVAALFGDGLIIGEAVAAGITVPVMAQFLGRNAWGATFVFWGLPVVALLVLWLWLAPRDPGMVRVVPRESTDEVSRTPETAPARRPRVNALHLGILLGGGSLIYFGMNSWIASYNQALHYTAMTPLALTTLNAAQLPVSIGVTLFAQRLAGRRLPFIVAGSICTLSIVGWLLTPGSLEPLWATLLGGSSAIVFTLGIALPPLLAGPQEVGRLTGMTISLTYAVAFIGPFVGGVLWDLSHLPAAAFAPVLIASLLLILLGARLPALSAFGLAP